MILHTTNGIDLVHIPSFQEQLDLPGTRFLGNFSALELADADSRAQSAHFTRRAQTLAGKWAAKEALLKAWSLALLGKPPRLGQDAVVMRELEILKDMYSRPYYRITGEIATHLQASLPGYTASVSISHDAEYATAICTLTYSSVI